MSQRRSSSFTRPQMPQAYLCWKTRLILHLYQSDVPILGQETEIQGLYPGQLGVVLEMNSIEYIFFANQAVADEYESIMQAEAEAESIQNDLNKVNTVK